ncbi:spore coat-associated protein N [Bacillus sp. SORGH_AS 510]|uniref:TasA family protein n=1 Tax=Bacillus sp. SORGH_AS_0510 TaxID=3041771 RepID=UPI00277FF3A7|nr:TasA family protein [Bacillus sp. SORGH_AS_0510]MDQ1146572.1 spore coat-associated protein N [Bacillus sp. SORGH_AS_0510]
MSLTKKMSQVVMSGALGLSLISGGTFAYFSDSVKTDNTFASGTLDLALNPNAVVNIGNIKPGDEVYREFTLENNGSLDIYKVLLNTKYTVEDVKSDNTDDFAKHIKVTIMYNTSSATNPVVETTLYDLQNQTPDLTAINEFVGSTQRPDGIPPGQKEKIFVLFEFVDNGQDQNQFQGDKLKVDWTFNAEQAPGTYYDDTDDSSN